LYSENLKRTDQSACTGANERIILKWITEKVDMKLWTVFNCLRIGQLLANANMVSNFWCHKRHGLLVSAPRHQLLIPDVSCYRFRKCSTWHYNIRSKEFIWNLPVWSWLDQSLIHYKQ
jgi:hypothetical protein